MRGPRSGLSKLTLPLTSLALLVLAVAFAKLADSAREGEGIAHLDSTITRGVVHHRTAWLTHVMRVVTVLGSNRVLIPVVVIASAVLIVRKQPRWAGFLVASVTGAAIMTAIIKGAIGRARPPLAFRLDAVGDAAFPSGHSSGSFACYAALAVVVVMLVPSRRWRALAIAGAAALIVAVGASRVYLGVHWTSDVLSGWILAAGWIGLLLVGALGSARFGVIAWRSRRNPASR